MTIPTFTMRQLLEAGVHFGHSTRRWNPKMEPYLFGVRNGTHIIDLQQTVPMLHQALSAIRNVVASGGRVLFVGTKRQASGKVAEAAARSGQYFVNHRWLGGMMTNWRTISNSIRRLRELEKQLDEEHLGLTKKETLRLTRERDKLERALGGIKEMGGLPDILFVIDTNKESIAVAEANKLKIPVVAVVDSNSDPAGIDFPIPGNDDALRAIGMYCDLVADSVIGGIQQEMVAAGVDVGGAEEQQERLADVDEATGAVDVVEPAEPTAAVEPAAAMEAIGTADVVEPAEPTSAVEPGAVAATQATEDAPASADEPSASVDEPTASADEPTASEDTPAEKPAAAT